VAGGAWGKSGAGPPGRANLVEGEASIGKGRLVREFLDPANGRVKTLAARCRAALAAMQAESTRGCDRARDRKPAATRAALRARRPPPRP
jgi:hypothetical protein